MLRVVLQQFARLDRLLEFSQGDPLCYHLLVRMLRDAEVISTGLITNALQDSNRVIRAKICH